MKRWISALVLIAALAPGASCRELTGGLRAGGGASILYGGWVEARRDELLGLGAATVTGRPHLSWRAGGWIDIPIHDALSLRLEPGVGAVGGALLASGGFDMLVGVAGLDLALPVLAVTRIALPAVEISLGAGIFLGMAVSVREVWNDGTTRTEGELASLLGNVGLAGGVGCAFPVGPGAITADLRVLGGLLSFAAPPLGATLDTVSFELTTGWRFGPRGTR